MAPARRLGNDLDGNPLLLQSFGDKEADASPAVDHHTPHRPLRSGKHPAEFLHRLAPGNQVDVVALPYVLAAAGHYRLSSTQNRGHDTGVREDDVAQALIGQCPPIDAELPDLDTAVGEVLHRRGVEAGQDAHYLLGHLDLGVDEEVYPQALRPDDLPRGRR